MKWERPTTGKTKIITRFLLLPKTLPNATSGEGQPETPDRLPVDPSNTVTAEEKELDKAVTLAAMLGAGGSETRWLETARIQYKYTRGPYHCLDRWKANLFIE